MNEDEEVIAEVAAEVEAEVMTDEDVNKINTNLIIRMLLK